jgi:hypothetical protein
MGALKGAGWLLVAGGWAPGAGRRAVGRTPLHAN